MENPEVDSVEVCLARSAVGRRQPAAARAPPSGSFALELENWTKASIGFECYVARSYEQGKLTLREVSKLLKLTLSETVDILSAMGVSGNIRSSEVLDSLKAIR
jgi:hypothetical protein